MLLLSILLLALRLLHVCSTCTEDTDCELNGQCQGGGCRCFPGWMGPTCGMLKLKPAPPMTASGSRYALYPMQRLIPPHHEGPAALSGAAEGLGLNIPITWGGTVFVEDNGVHHLFVDVICYSPSTIMHDQNGAQTVHATSKNPLNETFVFADVALPPEHDCPHIARAKDGTYLLYNTGQSMDCPNTCTGQPSNTTPTAEAQRRPCSGTGFFGLNVATSKSLSGPWTLHDNLPIQGYGLPIKVQGNVNPSPLVLDNGTVIVVYTDAANGEQIGLARTDDPTKTYTKLGAPGKPIFEHHCEDPYIYKGRSGYHVICHDMEADGKANPWGTRESNGCRFQGFGKQAFPVEPLQCPILAVCKYSGNPGVDDDSYTGVHRKRLGQTRSSARPVTKTAPARWASTPTQKPSRPTAPAGQPRRGWWGTHPSPPRTAAGSSSATGQSLASSGGSGRSCARTLRATPPT